MHSAREGGLNIDVKVGLVSGSPLVKGYVGADQGVGEFFSASYKDPGAYHRQAERLDGPDGDEQRRISAEILKDSGVDETNLRRWMDGKGVMVTAGQQPGLFGGPLYSVYKALSAVAAARELESALNRPVMPLFWVASEDHDWEEAGETCVLDVENEFHRIQVTPDPNDRSRPLFRVPLDQRISRLLDRFLALHPDTEFSGGLEATLRAAFRPERTLAEGFKSFMGSLVESLGIRFVHAHCPSLKRHTRSVLLRELDQAEEREAELGSVARQLTSKGYPVQVPILERGVNLFLEGPAGRERIYRDGTGSFSLRHSGTRLSREDILARTEEDPASLSPNVLLRPVVENAIFPVVATVVGPGEIGYHAQLAPVFAGHGVSPPVLVPRHSVTLVERKVSKVMEKFDLELEELGRPFHELAENLVQDEVPPKVRRALGSLRGHISRDLKELSTEAKGIDPTLQGPVDAARNQAFHTIDDLERKIVQSLKRENEVALAQVEKAQRHLFPDGKPQERVLNPAYYLSRYGPDLIRYLSETLQSQPVVPFGR